MFAFEKQTKRKLGNPGISLVNSNKTMDYDQIFDWFHLMDIFCTSYAHL